MEYAWVILNSVAVPPPFTNAQGVNRSVIRGNKDQHPTQNADPNNLGLKICGPGVAALTQTQTDFTVDEPLIQIVLCPYFFQTYRPALSGVTPQAQDFLDSYRFQASAFIHEMFHLFGNGCMSVCAA